MRHLFKRHGHTPTFRLLAYRPWLEGLEDRSLPSGFLQTNLVSDIPGMATFTDPNLKNPWGLAYGPGGPFWVSDNNSGLSTLYDGQGNNQGLVVTIPPPPGSVTGTLGTPTGTVFNPGNGFRVTENKVSGPAVFIFDSEDGTISAWAPSVDATNAVIAVDNSQGGAGAVYKGLTFDHNASGQFLLATNFRAGTVEVYDQNFHLTHLAGSFTDPGISSDFAPFGIQKIGHDVIVTYAKQDAAKHDDVPGLGRGFVSLFDENGNFLTRVASRGKLDAPWGIALAPTTGFGQFSGDLLIGNFGDGKINAYSTDHHQRIGTLLDGNGHPIVISGLWGLKFGNGGAAGPTTNLYFSAGINDEQDGLFGSLTHIPNSTASSQSSQSDSDRTLALGAAFQTTSSGTATAITGPALGGSDGAYLAALDSLMANDTQTHGGPIVGGR
jgi:uncharacterized protein (TIGR03118 family)